MNNLFLFGFFSCLNVSVCVCSQTKCIKSKKKLLNFNIVSLNYRCMTYCKENIKKTFTDHLNKVFLLEWERRN